MIKNLYWSIYWNIYWWFFKKSPIFISFNLLKFFSDWWKARKVFKRPSIVVHKIKDPSIGLGSDYLFAHMYTYNKWLKIQSCKCDWKSKWSSVRFESVPYLGIYLGGKAKWIIGLECPFYECRKLGNSLSINNNNMLYWEGVLSYLYDYDKDILKTFKNNIWHDDKAYFTIINALKPKYVKLIKKYYDDKSNQGECE